MSCCQHHGAHRHQPANRFFAVGPVRELGDDLGRAVVQLGGDTQQRLNPARGFVVVSFAANRLDKFYFLTTDEYFLELRAADRNIAFITTNFDLRALFERVTMIVDSNHHRGLLAGVANCLDFIQLVGPGQQVHAAFEQVALKLFLPRNFLF